MIEIYYADVSVGAAENAAFSGTDRQEYSSIDRLAYGLYGKKIATGEVGRWVLDGSVDILGATKQDFGFVSIEQSGADGTYEGEVGIDILFNGLFSSTGLTITFDNTEDVEYTAVVRWYKDATVLHEEIVVGADETAIETSVELYNKITVRFVSASKPYRFARICEVMFGVGRRFTPSDFEKVSLQQYVNPISEEVSVDTSKFVLRPPRDLNLIFQTRQPFSILADGKLLSAHYLDDAIVSQGNRYDITCQSAIGVLEEQPFSAVMWFDKNAYDAAVEIVGDDFSVDMEIALQTKTVTGYISDCSRREALHQLLFAIGAVCSTAGTDKIRIFKVADTIKDIGKNKIYTGIKTTRGSVVTSVEVEYYSYSNTKTSGATEIEVNGTVYYAKKGVLIRKNEAVVKNAKSNPKRISGATLLSQAQAEELMDTLYAYYTNNSVLTQKIIVDDEKPGDTVRTFDYDGASFVGAITAMETTVSHKLASQISVRGNNG